MTAQASERKLAEAAVFLRRFASRPQSVGAIWPSSPQLARTMLAPIDFAAARTIVEFGPGTGAFTAAIAQRLAPPARYLGVEIEPRFHAMLRTRFPDLSFENASAADLAVLAARHGISEIDAVVSGLPWATLPVGLQHAVFDAMAPLLARDGVFVTFGYVQGMLLPGAAALRETLKQRFVHVTRSRLVWRNLPPAFAYICRGNAARAAGSA